MNALFVPKAYKQPHWFFRYRVVDRLYLLGVIGYLIWIIVQLNEVRDKSIFDIYFRFPHQYYIYGYISLIVFGCVILLIPRFIYRFIIAYFVFNSILGLYSDVFDFLIKGRYDTAIAAIYRNTFHSNIFYVYILIKLVIWISPIFYHKLFPKPISDLSKPLIKIDS